MSAWLERTGAFHMHSRYSDGTGSVEEILRAARQVGLDYVVLTDHDTLAPRREGWEGTHDGVALIAASEITPRDEGHLLAMNVRRCAGYATLGNHAALDAIQAQGGYAVIAHPMGKRKLTLGIRHVPWDIWGHPVVRGLEIWSYTHDWVDGVHWWRLPLAHEFWKRPERRIRGPDPGVLRLWDQLGRCRRLSGLGGLDCHGRRVPLAGLIVFPYELMFRLMRNHIFVEPQAWASNPAAALWEALAEGRCFIAHDILADSAGGRCEALLPNGRALQMGEEAPFLPETVMSLVLPHEAEERWMANGRCRLREKTDRLITRPGGAGVYRFEAWLDGAPWVFTNPFYLR